MIKYLTCHVFIDRCVNISFSISKEVLEMPDKNTLFNLNQYFFARGRGNDQI